MLKQLIEQSGISQGLVLGFVKGKWTVRAVPYPDTSYRRAMGGALRGLSPLAVVANGDFPVEAEIGILPPQQ